MTQTWWLSFCDGHRPEGSQFLGAVVIDVTERNVADISALVTLQRAMHNRPPQNPEDDWFAAAVQETHLRGCNPGGEVQGMRLDALPDFATVSDRYPRGQLLSRADVDAIDAAIAQAAADDAPDPHRGS